MQQTEKYKLNLIEPSDPFLPKGLNENTQKIEEVLQTHMEGPVADLENRVTVLEGFRIAYGVAPSGQVIHLGFKPLVAFLNDTSNGKSALIVDGGIKTAYLALTDDGIIPGFGGMYVAFGHI